MMDAFMNYIGIAKGWSIPFSGRIAPRWMRHDATLMFNPSITKDALRCESCRAPGGKGIMRRTLLDGSKQAGAPCAGWLPKNLGLRSQTS